MVDGLISVAHFKGHELYGLKGNLKILGMWCTSREVKLSKHSNISPQVKENVCKFKEFLSRRQLIHPRDLPLMFISYPESFRPPALR